MGFQKNAFLGAASLYLYCICLRECIKLDTNTDTPARWSRGNLTHPSSVENVTSLSNPSSQGSAESESNFAQCTAEPYPQQAPCSHSPALARKKIRMQRYMGETGVYQIGEGWEFAMAEEPESHLFCFSTSATTPHSVSRRAAMAFAASNRRSSPPSPPPPPRSTRQRPRAAARRPRGYRPLVASDPGDRKSRRFRTIW